MLLAQPAGWSWGDAGRGVREKHMWMSWRISRQKHCFSRESALGIVQQQNTILILKWPCTELKKKKQKTQTLKPYNQQISLPFHTCYMWQVNMCGPIETCIKWQILWACGITHKVGVIAITTLGGWEAGEKVIRIRPCMWQVLGKWWLWREIKNYT